MALAGAQAADTMAQIDPIDTTRSLDRAVMHREDHAIALAQRGHFGPRLHARALFGQDELAA
jgi:hypothetical protein